MTERTSHARVVPRWPAGWTAEGSPGFRACVLLAMRPLTRAGASCILGWMLGRRSVKGGCLSSLAWTAAVLVEPPWSLQVRAVAAVLGSPAGGLPAGAADLARADHAGRINVGLGHALVDNLRSDVLFLLITARCKPLQPAVSGRRSCLLMGNSLPSSARGARIPCN